MKLASIGKRMQPETYHKMLFMLTWPFIRFYGWLCHHLICNAFFFKNRSFDELFWSTFWKYIYSTDKKITYIYTIVKNKMVCDYWLPERQQFVFLDKCQLYFLVAFSNFNNYIYFLFIFIVAEGYALKNPRRSFPLIYIE